MVATFNGWDEMPEAEREALERWEQEEQARPQGDEDEILGLGAVTELSGRWAAQQRERRA